ncbi:MAG: exonuclease domain-containing protein [Pseudobdellovibrionaceae bacterium]|nr:exonuclease domain-containing protein [Pseudobdellovibrionaceae bacterium]
MIGIIDFETTGLSPIEDDPVEFAAVIFDVERKRFARSYESLFPLFPTDPTKAEKVQNLCGITPLYCQTFHDDSGFRTVHRLMQSGVISHAVAFNAPFDRSFFEKTCTLLSLPMPSTPWICAKADVPYHLHNTRATSLTHTAADLGVLSPLKHRALGDCLTLMQVLQRFEWNDIIAYTAIPTIKVLALVSYNDREKAKAHGFYWDPITKRWFREMKANEDRSRFPFETVVVPV